MEATVLTISFDPERKIFPQEELEDFCINKEVHSIDGQFFQQDNSPFWTVLITYTKIVEKDPGVKNLTPEEKKLFEQLRAWRLEKAKEKGYPAYLVATNSQLVKMIQRRVRNQASIREIKGFGKKRIQNYGNEIIHIIKQFFPYVKT